MTEALDKVGLGDVDVSDMAAAGPMERRRADIVLRRLDGRILAGFRERASNRIVDLRQCPVLVPELFEMVGALRLLAQAFLAPGEDAAAAMTMTDDGIDLLCWICRGSRYGPPSISPTLRTERTVPVSRGAPSAETNR